MFNRENPQNSEPQNGPRSGLDYIALYACNGELKKLVLFLNCVVSYNQITSL